MDVQFYNAVVRADIQNLAAKLMGQMRDCLQMLMLVSKGLAGGKFVGMVVSRMTEGAIHFLHLPVLLLLGSRGLRRFLALCLLYCFSQSFLRRGYFPMVLQELLKDHRP